MVNLLGGREFGSDHDDQQHGEARQATTVFLEAEKHRANAVRTRSGIAAERSGALRRMTPALAAAGTCREMAAQENKTALAAADFMFGLLVA